MNENLMASIIVGTFSTALGWITWVVAATIRRTKSARRQAEVQAKLLDKFGGSQELLEYLQTEAGRSWLEWDKEAAPDPLARILRSLQVGVVLLSVGIAMLALRGMVGGDGTPLLVLGTLVTALAVGFLLSGSLAYVLSKAWGIIGKPAHEPRG